MRIIYMEFKGKNGRKYKIHGMPNGFYRFWEAGNWQYEMRGEIALQEMIQDVGRKGGKLVYATDVNGNTITSKGE